MTHLFAIATALAMSLAAAACGGSKQVAETPGQPIDFGGAEPPAGILTATAPAMLAQFDTLRLSSSACFGRCPVFTLTVAGDGSASYDGKQHTRYRGVHVGTVGGDTMTQLQAAVAQVLAQADTLTKEKDRNVMDAPQRELTVSANGEVHTFISKISFPGAVQDLFVVLADIAKREDWQATADTPPMPPHMLRVDLVEAIDMDALTGDYFRQRLEVVDTISTTPPSYMVRFDPYTMTQAEMVRSLEQKEYVAKVAIPTTAAE